MKRLVVTADDFGSAVEVNEAVERAHRDGMLTAASLMVGAPAAEDAIARAKRMPRLRIGLHLVLVEGRPASPPDRLPDLVGRDGNFRTDMAAMGAAMFFGKRTREQLHLEIEAQFARFAASGLTLDHVNTHKHFHLHPTIAGAMLAIGPRFGMHSVRVPLEPQRILSKIERRGWRVAPLQPLAKAVRRMFRRRGVISPDHVFGLAWSGHMHAARLRGIIENLPDGLSEIYLHPATSDHFAGSAPGYDHSGELAALTDEKAMTLARKRGISLGGFADFSPAAKIDG